MSEPPPPLDTGLVIEGRLDGTVEIAASLGELPPAALWETIVWAYRTGNRIEDVYQYLTENPDLAAVVDHLVAVGDMALIHLPHLSHLF